MQLSLSIGYGNSDGRCVVAIDYQHSGYILKLAAFMTCACTYVTEVVHQVSLFVPSMHSDAAFACNDLDCLHTYYISSAIDLQYSRGCSFRAVPVKLQP